MPSLQPTSTIGKVIIDPTGKKPVRVGQNIDGFDSMAVLEQIKEARMAGVKKQSDRIEKNQGVVIPAISTLQAKVQQLLADAKGLSSGFDSSYAFNNLQASVDKSGAYSQTSFVDVSIDTNVATTSASPVAIRITQLASVDSRITSSTATVLKADQASKIASSDDPLGLNGNFTINGGVITLIEADTLSTAIAKINSTNAGVKASYSKSGDNFYLLLSGQAYAAPLTFNDPGNLLATHFGINTTTPTNVDNLRAKIEQDVVDGALGVITKTYTYDSNSVTDLIAGVSLKLLNTTLNSSGTYDNLSVGISNNTKGVCDRIIEFFQHYNEVKEIINHNLLADADGNPIDQEASMARSPLIRQLSEQLNAISVFTPRENVQAGDYVHCQDIGVAIDTAASGFQIGTYTLANPQKLLAALSTNFEKVKKLFSGYAGNTVAILENTLDRSSGNFTTELARIKQENEKLNAQVERVKTGSERLEKKWIAQAARLDVERARYRELSKILGSMSAKNRD